MIQPSSPGSRKTKEYEQSLTKITIMKKQHFLTVIFFIAFFAITSLASAQTVYVTEKGKKYHKKNCTVVKEGKKGIELSDAKKKGLEPCATCKPEEGQKQVATEPKKK